MVQRTLQRLQAEFLEMPGLRLTARQVQRLCGIDEVTCLAVLDALIDTKFLRLNADGTYVRPADGILARSRPPKADVVRKYGVREAS
jgi:hypothetical protein